MTAPETYTIQEWFYATVVRVAEIAGETTYSERLQNAVAVTFEFDVGAAGSDGYTSKTVVEGYHLTVEMPWVWFYHFADQSDYVLARDPVALFGPDCPMIGHRCNLKLDNIETSATGDRFTALEGGAKIVGIEGYLASRKCGSINDLRDAISAVTSDKLPIYINDCVEGRFEEAGWYDIGIHRDEAGDTLGDHYTDFYLRRCAIFNGEKWSQRKGKFIQTQAKKRHVILTEAENQAQHETKVWFATVAAAPNLHIHFPIWIGEAYWAHPRTDDDVARIIQNCKVRAIPRPSDQS